MGVPFEVDSKQTERRTLKTLKFSGCFPRWFNWDSREVAVATAPESLVKGSTQTRFSVPFGRDKPPSGAVIDRARC